MSLTKGIFYGEGEKGGGGGGLRKDGSGCKAESTVRQLNQQLDYLLFCLHLYEDLNSDP